MFSLIWLSINTTLFLSVYQTLLQPSSFYLTISLIIFFISLSFTLSCLKNIHSFFSSTSLFFFSSSLSLFEFPSLSLHLVHHCHLLYFLLTLFLLFLFLFPSPHCHAQFLSISHYYLPVLHPSSTSHYPSLWFPSFLFSPSLLSGLYHHTTTHISSNYLLLVVHLTLRIITLFLLLFFLPPTAIIHHLHFYLTLNSCPNHGYHLGTADRVVLSVNILVSNSLNQHFSICDFHDKTDLISEKFTTKSNIYIYIYIYICKATWEPHKNAVYYFEQILEATNHKTAAVQPLTPILQTTQIKRTRHAGHCWRCRDELIRKVLLWVHTHRHNNVF